MAHDFEFEWDAVDLGYEWIENEVRYRSGGLTSNGRLLTVVWTLRNGKIRAVTGFPAGYSDKKAFCEISQ